MRSCRVCRQPSCREVVSFGCQPVCHRFLEGSEDETTFSLALGQCDACGVVQLIQPMPLQMIVPRYAWMTHKEPDSHVATLADHVASLPGVSRDSLILGIFEHDEPVLARLRAAGFHRAEKVDPVRDLGLSQDQAGAALVQRRIDRSTAEKIAGSMGRAEVVLSRRMLEHAYDPREFLLALRTLCQPQGYVVIEVPDCHQAFQQVDVGTIWEEHILYFTPHTFRACFAWNGLRLLRLDVFPHSLENSLVGTAQPMSAAEPPPSEPRCRPPADEMQAFAAGIASLRVEIHRFLANHRQHGGRIAWLGAGHRSCIYINLLQLGEFLECVIDDDPHKQHLRMPGSLLPILGAEALEDPRITLCVLCINPAAEDRVVRKNARFTERGGRFVSVSPGSVYPLLP